VHKRGLVGHHGSKDRHFSNGLVTKSRFAGTLMKGGTFFVFNFINRGGGGIATNPLGRGGGGLSTFFYASPFLR
jgi:hypothetical protein